jgi:hypothetical protein
VKYVRRALSPRFPIFITALAAVVFCRMEFAMAFADEKPRDLNTHHLFGPPDKSTWEKRRVELRRQVLFSAGLWPMPDKTPLNPKVTGKVDAEDYSIENVALETRPGFYLCGNLYRPKGKPGKRPGIVNPHGHWSNGRLEMQPDVPKADPKGKMGEGRGNLVSIGVNLARQGFVVFAYDAVGYNDTKQVNHEFARGLGPWANGVSIMGLQLWDSIRVVDYLQSLKDVDPNRIGCTGASGGGSQTFLLTAVDDRVKVSVPVNMVSAHMQGGCLCENGPALRVGTDNAEIAALTAPRPMLLVACTGDWTKNNPHEEWPAIKKIYDQYGAGDRTAVVQFNYQHNYNVESREAMYAWFGRWLLGDPNPENFREKPFTADVKTMRVWTDAQPLPSSALAEPALTSALSLDARKRMESLWPKDAASMKRFRDIYRPALEISLSARYPAATDRRGSSSSGRALLLVCSTGAEDRAQQVMSQLRDRYDSASLVAISAITKPASDLWKDFFSTYNRTPLGDRVQKVADLIAEKEAAGASDIDVIGVGDAGTWALLAQAVAPAGRGARRLAVDLEGIDLTSDALFAGPLYAPGIRQAGDLTSAAALAAPAELIICNPGKGLSEETLKRAIRAGGGKVKLESSPLSATSLSGWF